MICPICNKDMETGFVKFCVNRGIFKGNLLWEDEKSNSKPIIMKLNEHHSENFDTPVYKAFKCNHCEKIILSTFISDDISKKICPQCNANIDFDYPKCPKCKFVF